MTYLTHDEQMVLSAIYILSGGMPDVSVHRDDVLRLINSYSLAELKAKVEAIMGAKGPS